MGRKRGKIAQVYMVQSLNPSALRAHLDLYMSIMYRRGELIRAQREMIGVLVSSLNRCRYCLIHHREALQTYVKDETVVEGISTDFRRAPLERRDRVMLEYCEKLTRNPSEMSEGDVQVLRDVGFGDEAILDINLIASYFNFVNRMVLGLGVELEPEEEREYRY